MAGGRTGLKDARVVLLSGGTGGAKLARGLLDVCDELTVVANTGDDVEVYGAHVSPDPDLLTYWLADQIDERGWGLRGDTFAVMDALRGAGRPAWFRLGDRDLAMCLVRTEELRAGRRLTDAHAAVVAALGVEARVLPMADEAVATQVRHHGRLIPFQQYMIVEGAAPPVDGVELFGVERARPTDDVLSVLAEADLIVVGPSNPVISIGPILALPGMREAVAAAPAPVVAVSPFVGGRSVKGPSEQFCAWAGIEVSATGIAQAYAGLVDGIVADEPVEGLPCLVADTLMDTPERRREVAREVVEFGLGASLAPARR
ncbi:MAG: 2-phospho-L-lactate transferase [Thermoleophilaceae bacterium]